MEECEDPLHLVSYETANMFWTKQACCVHIIHFLLAPIDLTMN